MKIKYFIGFFVISLAIIASVAWAQDVQFPVKELGDCQNQSACKSYCDKPENIEACVSFAEKNGLMPKEEIEAAKKFIAAGSKGPGGCSGRDECENFCNDITHIDECIAFGEKNNLMPPEELKEAKMVQAAIKRGAKPPACNGKKACDAYCEDSNHMEECIAFGAEAGFIQGKELEDAQKMLTAVRKGAKPPPCKGKEACDVYCSSPDNIEVCMTFAKEAGFMTPEEAENSEKMMTAIKKGVKPPPCKGKEACDAYCSEDSHVEECVNFSVAAGFMDEKDAEMAKKTKGKGPGDCKGREECEAFCKNPDNQETCLNFAKENGMMSEEDLKRMEEGRRGDRGDQGNREDMNREFQPGPGAENPGSQMMPQQAGPGGCKGPEECKSYCESNPDQCKNFLPPQGNREKMMPKEGETGEEMMPFQKNQERMMLPNEGEIKEEMMRREGEIRARMMLPQENQEGMMQPPIDQQPQNFQQPTDMRPPIDNISPPPLPPSETPAPAPETAPVPAPSSFTPGAPMASLLNIFLFMLK
ncbi:hypothetical protein A3I82_01670 [Candidatus Azambacteria bacterium RIFCSPLOWO2_02_FULL_42_10]|nr:MAG: hypothetical protein A3I82_01670 [Candidatus Azambacteria bacterium RIFCSPLOWO2_02_FULL_42_10]